MNEDQLPVITFVLKELAKTKKSNKLHIQDVLDEIMDIMLDHYDGSMKHDEYVKSWRGYVNAAAEKNGLKIAYRAKPTKFSEAWKERLRSRNIPMPSNLSPGESVSSINFDLATTSTPIPLIISPSGKGKPLATQKASASTPNPRDSISTLDINMSTTSTPIPLITSPSGKGKRLATQKASASTPNPRDSISTLDINMATTSTPIPQITSPSLQPDSVASRKRYRKSTTDYLQNKQKKESRFQRNAERRARRFQDLLLRGKDKFWTLSSGRNVEEILFEACQDAMNSTIKIRSYTIDKDCQITKALFTEEEWREISAHFKYFELDKLPSSVDTYLRDMVKRVQSGESMEGYPLPNDRSMSISHMHCCKIARNSVVQWQDLYNSSPPPLMMFSQLSEAYLARNAWPLLLELLNDIPGIIMIDNEEPGVDFTIRRKRVKEFMDTASGTHIWKEVGKKFALVAKDVEWNNYWFITERMSHRDAYFSKDNKRQKQLFQEIHTIMVLRLLDAKNTEVFRGKARFFGICTSGTTFQAFGLQPTPASSTSFVALYQKYNTFRLPISPFWQNHYDALVFLLQIKLALTEAIQAHSTALLSPILNQIFDDDDDDNDDDANDASSDSLLPDMSCS